MSLEKLVPIAILATLFSKPLLAETNLESQIAVDITQRHLSLGHAIKELKWEFGLVVAGTTYLGLDNWNWGSSNTFRTVDEGWFGTDTGSAGADKLGHMYSTYLINELFTKRLIDKGYTPTEASRNGALLAGGIMLWVEAFDGYSVDHGFSYEDVILNTAGIGISYLKNTIPGLDDKIDLRVEYHPTHEHGDHPITDYSGYTYSGVLKLAGFERFKNTPLKYVELQLGYHTEGFKKNEEKYYNEKKTELQLAIGLDLSEALFKPVKRYAESDWIDYIDTFFRYYQMPGAYLPVTLNKRTTPYR